MKVDIPWEDVDRGALTDLCDTCPMIFFSELPTSINDLIWSLSCLVNQRGYTFGAYICRKTVRRG